MMEVLPCQWTMALQRGTQKTPAQGTDSTSWPQPVEERVTRGDVQQLKLPGQLWGSIGKGVHYQQEGKSWKEASLGY